MKDTTVMEKHKIVLLPIMWINQLLQNKSFHEQRKKGGANSSPEERWLGVAFCIGSHELV